MITKEYLHERFTYCDGELYWKTVFSNRLKVGQLAGDKDGKGYRRIMMGKKHYKMHRLIWIMFYGDIPDNIIIDHIDRDIQNNKIQNLRLATKSENNRNRVANGVTYDASRKKWKAQSSINNKTVFLGRFDNIEDAKLEFQNFTKYLSENEEVISETS